MNQLVIQPSEIQVIVKQEMKQIVLQPLPFPQLIIQGVVTMAGIKNFSFVCTIQGQTVFGPLAFAPSAILALGITGALQNPAAATPDYTVNGLYITTSQGLNLGDTLYGSMTI